MLKDIFSFERVVIGWDSIRIQLWIFLGIIVLIGTMSSLKYLKCVKEFNNRNWNYVIKQKSYFNHISKGKRLHDDCMFMLAVANFELYQDEEFILYISQMKSSRLLGAKLAYKIKYLIVNNDTSTPDLDQLMAQLHSLEDEQSKEFFKANNLLYRIKFEGHVCSPEEMEVLKELRSDRVRKEFLQ